MVLPNLLLVLACGTAGFLSISGHACREECQNHFLNDINLNNEKEFPFKSKYMDDKVINSLKRMGFSEFFKHYFSILIIWRLRYRVSQVSCNIKNQHISASRSLNQSLRRNLKRFGLHFLHAKIYDNLIILSVTTFL